MSELSRTIAERRKWLELSQADVARRAGLTTSQISRIESEVATPRLDSVEALARALDAVLVLVPLDRLTEVRRVVGAALAVADPGAGSAFEDIFIPDPENQNG